MEAPNTANTEPPPTNTEAPITNTEAPNAAASANAVIVHAEDTGGGAVAALAAAGAEGVEDAATELARVIAEVAAVWPPKELPNGRAEYTVWCDVLGVYKFKCGACTGKCNDKGRVLKAAGHGNVYRNFIRHMKLPSHIKKAGLDRAPEPALPKRAVGPPDRLVMVPPARCTPTENATQLDKVYAPAQAFPSGGWRRPTATPAATPTAAGKQSSRLDPTRGNDQYTHGFLFEANGAELAAPRRAMLEAAADEYVKRCADEGMKCSVNIELDEARCGGCHKVAVKSWFTNCGRKDTTNTSQMRSHWNSSACAGARKGVLSHFCVGGRGRTPAPTARPAPTPKAGNVLTANDVCYGCHLPDVTVVDKAGGRCTVPTRTMFGTSHSYVAFSVETGLDLTYAGQDGKLRHINGVLRAKAYVDWHRRQQPGCARLAVDNDGNPTGNNMCSACQTIGHRDSVRSALLAQAANVGGDANRINVNYMPEAMQRAKMENTTTRLDREKARAARAVAKAAADKAELTRLQKQAKTEPFRVAAKLARVVGSEFASDVAVPLAIMKDTADLIWRVVQDKEANAAGGNSNLRNGHRPSEVTKRWGEVDKLMGGGRFSRRNEANYTAGTARSVQRHIRNAKLGQGEANMEPSDIITESRVVAVIKRFQRDHEALIKSGDASEGDVLLFAFAQDETAKRAGPQLLDGKIIDTCGLHGVGTTTSAISGVQSRSTPTTL